MEDGIVSISRAAGTVIYPAKFMLVAAANPCPCGNLGSDTKRCTCMPGVIMRYQKRISGPIQDRIDLHIQVPAVQTDKLTAADTHSESSQVVRERVQKARNIQTGRFGNAMIAANAEMSTKMVKEICALSTEPALFLRQAVTRFALSARSYYRVLKVARTIADLAGEKNILLSHIAESLTYRYSESTQ